MQQGQINRKLGQATTERKVQANADIPSQAKPFTASTTDNQLDSELDVITVFYGAAQRQPKDSHATASKCMPSDPPLTITAVDIAAANANHSNNHCVNSGCLNISVLTAESSAAQYVNSTHTDEISVAVDTPLPAHSKPIQLRLFWIMLPVLVLHSLVIVLINYFWVAPQHPDRKQALPKIRSYLYVAPKSAPVKPSVTEAQTDIAQQDKELNNKLQLIDKVESESINKETIKHASEKLAAVQLQVADEQATNEQSPLLEAEPQHIAQPSWQQQKSSAAAYFETKPQINNQAEQLDFSSVSDRFTQSYLQKQQAGKLQQLVSSSGAEYTQKRSLSEMDGDMQELVFPEVDLYSKVVTTDHKLDPNRIVKKGDTCYRIVKIGDQINPYAETIGFPFNCGEDKVKQAIKDAIAKRLLQRMISR